MSALDLDVMYGEVEESGYPRLLGTQVVPSGARGFESHPLRLNAGIIQWLECFPSKEDVAGSNPATRFS